MSANQAFFCLIKNHSSSNQLKDFKDNSCNKKANKEEKTTSDKTSNRI